MVRSLKDDVERHKSLTYRLLHYGVLGLAIDIIACIATIKTHLQIAWFSLAVVLISWGSGPAQGIHRYILGAPAVFITLAPWGKQPGFDRAWTILSVMLMGLLAMLFAFDMWVA